MIIDNFNSIYVWLEHLNEGDFYWIQIYCRKKDGNNVSDKIVIKNYTIFNTDELKKYESEIKTLCVNNNARAYIWVNPRNYKQFQLNLIEKTVEAIKNNTQSTYKLIDKAIVNSRSPKYNRIFILDIDCKDLNIVDAYKDVVSKCGLIENIEYDSLKTVNGYHLLSHRFNQTKFEHLVRLEQLPSIDIHKDNPTLLYYEVQSYI